MILRFLQFWSVLTTGYLLLRYASEQADFGWVATYWRELYFIIIAVTTAWLFVVTQSLRPVVALFAAAGFVVIALMDEPTGASFLATVDGMAARVLTIREG